MTPQDLQVLFEQGRHREVLDQFAQLETQGKFTLLREDEQIECLYYKSRALERLERYDEALQVATEARQTFPSPSNKSLTLALLCAQCFALFNSGRYDEVLKLIVEGDAIFKTLTAKEHQSESNWVALFYHIKGGAHMLEGEPDRALEYCQRSLALYEALGNSYDIAVILHTMGHIYSAKDEVETALEYYQRSLDLCEEIGNLVGTAHSLMNMGYLYFNNGELATALDYLQRSVVVSEELGYLYITTAALTHISSIYWYKGELATALEYLQRSLALSKGIFQKDVSDFMMAGSLFRLIMVTLDQEDHIQAQSYLKELQQIQKRASDKWIDFFSLLAEALVLKRSSRMKHKAQAQTILEQLIGEVKKLFWIHFFLHTLVTVHLCDLLLFEVKSTGELDVWEKVKTLIQQLYTQAQDRQSVVIMCEVLLLQAKFAAIDGDLQQAQNYLDQAKVSAKEKALGLLSQKITVEQQRFEAEFEKWRALIQRNAPLQERVDHARLQDYLHDVQKFVKVMDARRKD